MSRAPLPGATVTVRSVDTNTSKTARSGESGIYSIPLLLPGTYEITVEAPGLETQVRKDVRLEVNQTATLDFTLKVAAVATTVDVTAEVPLLQSETSSVGTTLESGIIENYPLPERDIMGALRSIPGVVSSSQVGAARGARNVFDSTFSVAGGRSSTNEVLIDGASNTIGDFNGVVILPPPDSVQEVRVETSAYSAEFGRTGGGTVNIVTKNGTNQYHGNLYYYHQNTALNANSFTNNRFGIVNPRLRRHQYGGTFGGPVCIPKLYNGRSKTFFFVSYEGRRENNPAGQGPFSLPTALEKNGDFSQTLVGPSGSLQHVTIYNPFTTVVTNGVPDRQPFAGNVIPASLINPVARKVLDYYPEPNRPGSPLTGRLNYVFNGQQRYYRDVVSGRIDQFLSERHRLFGRLNMQENLDQSPGTIVKFASTTSNWDHFKNFGFDDSYQFSTHLTGILRYNFTRFRANQINGSLGFDPVTKLGLPGYIDASANLLAFPDFTLSQGTFPNFGGAFNYQPRDTQDVSGQAIWTKNRHSIHMGGEYRLYRFYPYQLAGSPTGQFGFSQSFTQRNPLAATKPAEGFDLASLLLGTGSYSFEHREPLTLYHHYWAGYVQDDWKIASRLTLNLGLRWEVETGTGESHDRLTYFDPNAPSPLANGPKGAVLFTGHGNPRTIRATNWTDFGPRAGFAYRIGNKTAIRGGYGIFYLPLGVESDIVTTPFSYVINGQSTNADYTPFTTLSNPFPNGLPAPASASRVDNGSYKLGTNVSTYLRDQPAGYIQEWNFGGGRQIGKTMVVDVTYNGSRGVHLPVPNVELNQVPSQYLALGKAYLTAQVPNPFFGQLPSSALLSRPTIPRGQLLKPFPQFAANSGADYYGGSIFYSRPPLGDSIYHAVTFKLERRFSKGLSVSGAYTISKLIDIGGVGNGAAFTDASGIRDLYNVRLERSVSAWDIPQRFVLTYQYELPFGRGKPLLNRRGFIDRVVGGWEVLSVHVFESGRPIAVGDSDRSRLASTGPSRATVVAGQDPFIDYNTARSNAALWDPSCNCTKPWFNIAAFTTNAEFVVPNGPRFLPNVRSDHLRNWDISLNKRLRIREGMSFVLSAHAFNLLNSVYWGAPVGTVTATNFGSVTSVQNQPRRVELGGKLTF